MLFLQVIWWPLINSSTVTNKQAGMLYHILSYRQLRGVAVFRYQPLQTIYRTYSLLDGFIAIMYWLLQLIFSNEHILTPFFCQHSSLINTKQNNRLREPHPSEKGTTSLTRHVAVVARLRTTSRRRHAQAVATPPRRWGIIIRDPRPRAGELLVPDVWDTWRHWLVGLRMDLGRVHRLRSRLPPRSKL